MRSYEFLHTYPHIDTDSDILSILTHGSRTKRSFYDSIKIYMHPTVHRLVLLEGTFVEIVHVSINEPYVTFS